MEYELVTDSSDTAFEIAVADLWSEWGVDVDVRTVDEATFGEQWERGEYDMWPESWLTGDFRNVGIHPWRRITGAISHMGAYGMWSDERLERIRDLLPPEIDSFGGEMAILEEEGTRTIYEIPPIGEPYGERTVEVNPGFEAYDAHYYIPDFELAEDADFWQRMYWFSNWSLAVVPCYSVGRQRWFNMENWNWSRAEGHTMWEFLVSGAGTGGGDGWHTGEMLASGWVDADPENPK